MLLVYKEAPELTQGPELVQLFQEKLDGALIEFDAENAEIIGKYADWTVIYSHSEVNLHFQIAKKVTNNLI